MATPGGIRGRVEGTTRGLGGATTIPTGIRLYAPNSQSTGAGVPDAAQAVDGVQTTVMSGPALATTAALGAGGSWWYLTRRSR